GTGAGIEERIDIARRLFRQPRRQVQNRLVHDGRVLTMNQLADLLLRRGNDLGMTMAGAGHTDTGGKVDITTPFRIEKVGTLTMIGENMRCLLEQRRQMTGCHGILLTESWVYT